MILFLFLYNWSVNVCVCMTGLDLRLWNYVQHLIDTIIQQKLLINMVSMADCGFVFWTEIVCAFFLIQKSGFFYLYFHVLIFIDVPHRMQRISTFHHTSNLEENMYLPGPDITLCLQGDTFVKASISNAIKDKLLNWMEIYMQKIR